MHDLVDYLHAAVENRGSDLHIAVGRPPCSRIDGDLVPLNEGPLTAEAARDLIFSVLSEPQRAKLDNDLELDFALEVRGLGRFRGNAHYTKTHVEAAFRHIPETVPDLAELGHGETVEQICDIRQGLVLVTGITGSGKTTTLAAMAKHIMARRPCMMITIEDPVEYVIDHGVGIVKQRQIGLDSHSFPNALRAALRQDPDVIFVSELRDFETIRTAVTAAETGHLVVGTLHTIDAPKSLDRLIDVFPADQQRQITTQIANCLEAVISQRLLRRADAPGRVLATEIMLNNSGVQAIIRERRFQQLIGMIEIGRAEGMHTIDASLAHLLAHGHISAEDAFAFCRDPEAMQEALRENLKRSAAGP
jgi:twitching motility protein PilT